MPGYQISSETWGGDCFGSLTEQTLPVNEKVCPDDGIFGGTTVFETTVPLLARISHAIGRGPYPGKPGEGATRWKSRYARET